MSKSKRMLAWILTFAILVCNLLVAVPETAWAAQALRLDAEISEFDGEEATVTKKIKATKDGTNTSGTDATFQVKDGFGINDTRGGLMTLNGTGAEQRISGTDTYTLKKGKIYYASVWAKSDTPDTGTSFRTYFKGYHVDGKINGSKMTKTSGYYGSPGKAATVGEWTQYSLSIQVDKIYKSYKVDGTSYYVEITPNEDGSFPSGTAKGTTADDGVFTPDGGKILFDVYMPVASFVSGKWNSKTVATFPTQMYVDNWYVIEEDSETSVNITKPTVANVKIANGEGQEAASFDDVLTATATTGDVNPKASVSLSWQWQTSDDGINYSNIDGATSNTYTVTKNDADTYLRAVATASSEGAESGKTTVTGASNAILIPDETTGMVAGVSVDAATTVLKIDQSADLNAIAVDKRGNAVEGVEVSYAVENPEIAEIKDGKIVAKREGLTTVTATVGNYSKSYMLIVYSEILQEQTFASESGLTQAYFADKSSIKENNSATVKTGAGSRTGKGNYWESRQTPIVLAATEVDGKTYQMSKSAHRFSLSAINGTANKSKPQYGTIKERGVFQLWFYDDMQNGEAGVNNGKQVSFEFMGFSGTYQDENGQLYPTFPDGTANDGSKNWNLSFRVYLRLDGKNNTYNVTQDSKLFGNWTQEKTCPTRSKGWHQLIVDYTQESTIALYLDGQKAFTRNTGDLPSNGGITTMKINRHGISLEANDANHYVKVSDVAKYDVSVTKTYDVSVEVGQGGSVTIGDNTYGGGTTGKEKVLWGGNLDMTITPAEGYLLESVTVNGTEKTMDATGGTLNLSNVKENAEIKVTFKEIASIPKYDLTVTASENGTVTVNGDTVNGTYTKEDIYEGIQYIVKVTPENGYQATVSVNGKETSLTEDTLVVSMNQDVAVDVTFTKIPKATVTSISLSENTSFYTKALAETPIKVWGYNTKGEKVDLTGQGDLFFSSSAPWIFKVADGKISSGSVAGSAIITATYTNPDGSEAVASLWMTRTETTPATFGFTTSDTASGYLLNSGDMKGHDGNSVLAYYQKGKQYAQNYGLRVYVGRQNGENNWYNRGLRAAQGWFYDDGVNNSGFYISMCDNTYYNSSFDTKMVSDSKHNTFSVSRYPIGAHDNAEYYMAHSGVVTEVKRTKGWHQVVVMLDTDTKELNSYIDGVKVATTKVASSAPALSDASKGDSHIELRSTQGPNAGYQTNVTLDANHYFDDIAAYDMPKSEAPAMAPVVTKATLTGIPMAGQMVAVAYEIIDYNNDELGDHQIQWQISEDGINNWTDIKDATDLSLILDTEYVGQFIRVAITPYSKAEPKKGDTVYTSVMGAISPLKTPPSAASVKIQGEFALDQVLTANYEYIKSEGGDGQGESKISWEIADSENGPYTEVATGITFTVNASAAGRYLRVTVTPQDTNGLYGDPVSSKAIRIPGTVTYYVATDGDDSNPGTIDKPFATLEAARDALRGTEVPEGGATVYIRGGVYNRTKSFALTSSDSGSEGAPIVYRPYGDEEVVLHGGYNLNLSDFKAVEGEMKALLPSAVQDKVVVADLAELGVDTISEYAGLGGDGGLNAPIISLDGQVMNLARYPNARDITKWPTMYCAPKKAGYEGTNLGNGQTDPDTHAFTVQYDDVTAERVANWTYGLDHIAAEGFWRFDWWASTRYVTINKEKKQITARENKDTNYGVYENKERVFCFKNVYQELDEAGEYYIDFDNQKLYVYPYEGADETSFFKMSNLNKNLIEMNNVSNVTIQGLELTSGKQKAINAGNCNSVVIEDCYINGFQTNAISLTGYNNAIINNDMEFFGTGAVSFSGGDKATITPGNNRVENNKINDFALLKPIYSAGVSIDGVGNVISHNDIYNCEHYAVYFAGVDNIIEYNDIHNACTNAADMGAIYTGRHFDDHGTIIRYNHFHDIGNPLSRQFYPCAIFTDDGSSDMDVYGNIFGKGLVNVEAVKVHGGQFNNVYHNLFVDVSVIFYSAEWGDGQWRASLSDSTGTKYAKNQYWDRFDSVRNNPLYRERWPWLAEASDAYDAGNMNSIVHHSNIVGENLIIYVDSEPEAFEPKAAITDLPIRATKGWYRAYGNHTLPGLNDGNGNTNVLILPDENNKKYFEDYDNGNLRLTDESLYDLFEESTIKGSFEPIPFDEIGMYDMAQNSVPSAIGLFINQSDENSLSGLYEYRDEERDPEGTSLYRWLVSDSINGIYSPIAGATGKTLTLTEELSGKFVKFEVTAVSADGQKGTPVLSSAYAIAADKDSLNQIIEAVEKMADSVTIGSDLGDYTQENVNALKNAIAAAKEVAANEKATGADVSDAAASLTSAYEAFGKTANNQASTDKEEVNVPEGLSNVEITFTGEQKEVTVSFDEEKAPATTITLGDVVVTIQEGTVIPDGELKIAILDGASVKLFGEVGTIVSVGDKGASFNKSVRIEFAGNVSDDIIHIDETYTKITKVLNTDSATALSNANYGKIGAGEGKVAVWTLLGGEYAAANLIVPSSEAQLKSLKINGKDYIKFKPETLSYRYALSAGTTAIPEVTAEAADENATVTIEPATELPGDTVITVTAEDGSTACVYTITFFAMTTSTPTTTPTVRPTTSTGTGTGGGSISVGGGNSGKTEEVAKSKFTDIIGHWAEKDINDMATKGIVSGVTATTFEPDRSITRAEFAALMARALKLSAGNTESVFADVANDAWYAKEVSAAAAAGLIVGYDGNFRPNDTITREEMAVVIMKAYAFLGKTASSGQIDKFADKDTISDWAVNYVDQAVSTGMISGMSADTFAPKENATRAQVTSLIKRLLSR